MTSADLGRRLTVSRYPRSAHYDPVWLVDNMMGPCSVWLTEALTDVMPLTAGDHVLDLGCGQAMSSIFLAREFHTYVVAADLWIAAHENQRRIDDAGLAASITPIHLDANKLDLSDESFDAIVCIDAYHYFAAQPGTLTAIVRLLRPGGRIGVVVPAVRTEIDAWPEHLAPWWQNGFETFHSPAWWADLWTREEVVHLERADLVPHGAEDWLTWTEAWDDWARANDRAPYELESQMLRADRDHLLGFTRLVAIKT